MSRLKANQSIGIDGNRDMRLVAAILQTVANHSRFYNEDEAERRLDVFKGIGEERVFLHYMMLIKAGFIEGAASVQTWTVTALHLTWEGYDLLDTLANKYGGTHGLLMTEAASST